MDSPRDLALLDANWDLVQRIVGPVRIPPQGALDRDDLVSVGNEAMVRAVRCYDQAKSTLGFRSHAYLYVRGAVVDELRRVVVSRKRSAQADWQLPQSLDQVLPSGHTLGEVLADPRANVEELVERRARLREAVAIPLAVHRKQKRPEFGEGLTVIEFGVLLAAAEGETASETAARTGRAEETIRSHGQHVLRKLGARNIAHAVHLEHHLLFPIGGPE